MRQPLGLEDLKPRDLYVRQLWDSKISADISAMRPSDLAVHARLYEAGDLDAGVWSAGLAQGLIHDVPTVSELVDRIIAEATCVVE